MARPPAHRLPHEAAGAGAPMLPGGGPPLPSPLSVPRLLPRSASAGSAGAAVWRALPVGFPNPGLDSGSCEEVDVEAVDPREGAHDGCGEAPPEHCSPPRPGGGAGGAAFGSATHGSMSMSVSTPTAVQVHNLAAAAAAAGSGGGDSDSVEMMVDTPSTSTSLPMPYHEQQPYLTSPYHQRRVPPGPHQAAAAGAPGSAGPAPHHNQQHHMRYPGTAASAAAAGHAPHVDPTQLLPGAASWPGESTADSCLRDSGGGGVGGDAGGGPHAAHPYGYPATVAAGGGAAGCWGPALAGGSPPHNYHQHHPLHHPHAPPPSAWPGGWGLGGPGGFSASLPSLPTIREGCSTGGAGGEAERAPGAGGGGGGGGPDAMDVCMEGDAARPGPAAGCFQEVALLR
ncbi:hypothetical protein GPECTOR_154g74 [Gonium pectorale]|uniref:Uncharacterized protein n=1 Tax=Gonium pectorale TaxID=33097 RepID=A0A150FXP0_GONPE|nr:hypothetical protein GPECTOR_154g74 [Gonium pectorale]|eukprot:KXZ42383.1 hypothetical protein GPECTOR_154g74 [Gonium pectorale]